jgi:peroxiredoxin
MMLLASVLGVTSVTTALDVGQQAPDFTLPSTTGEQISPSQFRGKQLVLIEFYGVDFEPVWAENLSTRKVDYSKFQDLNVQILGISANSPFSQKTFADSLKLPYPLLSDFPDLKVIQQYTGLQDLKVTAARRAFFLLDQQGVIRGRWFGEALAVLPSEPILDKAREIAGKR